MKGSAVAVINTLAALITSSVLMSSAMVVLS
jgi:hypothetical protein